MAVMRAAKMVVQTALSRVDSKVERKAVSLDWSWADYLVAYWAGPKVDLMVKKLAVHLA